MPKPITFAVLVILIAFGGFYWWKSQDPQVVNHKVDQLIEVLEYRKLSLDNREERHEKMREVMADQISFEGSAPVPTGEITIDELLEKLDLLQSFATRVDVIESERIVNIDGDSAKVTVLWDIDAAVGKQFKTRETWTLIFDLEKGPDWRIYQIKALSQKPSAAARF